jgi:hypothetical protein
MAAGGIVKLRIVVNQILTINPHGGIGQMESVMRPMQKRLEMLCFGLYVAAIVFGTSMDALGQIFSR